MPHYDYCCDHCGHTFEAFQNMSDPLLRKCPKCGRLKLRRLIGAGAGIRFNGSGFYETDYKTGIGSKSEGVGDTKPQEKKSPAKKETQTAPAKD